MAWTPINTNDFDKSYYSGATDNELGALFNANYGQVRHYLTDRYNDAENPLARRGSFTPTENIILDDTIKDLDLRVLKVVTTSSKSVSIEDICNTLDVSPKRLTESLVRLKMNHYTINAVNGQLIVDKPKSVDYKIYTRDLAEGRKYKFGVASDQHLGSKYERSDVNEGLYDAFEAAGVTKVLNTGNWIEGEARFNKNDILVHGMGNQVEYFVENYPKRDGIKTLMIAGDDHEGWYWQQSGIDIGAYTEMACKRAGRDDIEYLGYLEADVLFGADNVFTKVRLMHPGGGSCFDDTAEILTETRGWVAFADLTLEDKVATMTKDTHEFQWQNPTTITNEPYSGKMYKFSGRTIEFQVTPNHKFWTRYQAGMYNHVKDTTYPQKATYKYPLGWYAETAEEMVNNYQRQRYSLPRACNTWSGELTPIITIPRLEPMMLGNSRNVEQMQHLGECSVYDIAELIAWYVTEGYADKKRVTICQSKRVNPENHAKITSLFERLALRYTVSGLDEKDITVSSKELSEYLNNECGSGSRNKYLPLWLKNQPTDVLQLVLDTMIEGDGWVNGKSWGYKSISTRLVDDVSEIAQKLGYGVHISDDYQSVSISTEQLTPTLNTKPEEVQYDGSIYCCSVPNELIYVKVNGKCFWSHNSYAVSYKPQKIVESISVHDKPDILLIGHYHKSMYMQHQGVHVIQAGTTKDQDLFMRKHQLAAHIGGWIVEFTQLPDGSVGSITTTWIPFDANHWKHLN